MWQIPRTILLEATALALLFPVLLAQNNPQIASRSTIRNMEIASVKSDPSSMELFTSKPGKVEPTPTPTAVPVPTPLVQVAAVSYQKPAVVSSNAVDLINKYASEYGANPHVMIMIAQCESGMRPEALSPSGAYAGMFQFVSSTWISNRKAMGEDSNPDLRFNGEEAIKTAAFKMGRDGYGAWPVCSKKAFAQLGMASQ